MINNNNNTATLEIIPQGVGIIWLDQPNSKVNVLGPHILNEFEQVFEDVAKNDTIKAIVLISRKKDFIAGADVENVLAAQNPEEWEMVIRRGQAILNLIENYDKPVVAAINGTALGGGLEVALACHYRIATNAKHTVLALPEVLLGLIPAGGGTQRLPALVGWGRGLNLALTGRKLYAKQALKYGVVDDIVQPEALLNTATQVALKLAIEGKKIIRKPKLSFLESLVEGNFISKSILFKKARKTVQATTFGNYPAPLKIIECMELGAKYGALAGYEAEARNFAALTVHPVAKALMGLFVGITKRKTHLQAHLIRPVKKIAVFGAGLMGTGIAKASIEAGFEVLLTDKHPDKLTHAQQTLYKAWLKKQNRNIITPLQLDQHLGRLSTAVSNLANFKHTDLIIEAVFEDLDLKQQILAHCEANSPDNCIFATNTSALPLSQIVAHATRPQQVVGMHYFSPVDKMQLLEIVVQPNTADWVRETARQIGILQGKTCIVVKDSPGFYTTRILSPLLNEAMLMVAEGILPTRIDKCACEAGFPVGPLTLIDEIGLDVAIHGLSGAVGDLFIQRAGGKNYASNLPAQLTQTGCLGRKKGMGFYVYKSEKGEMVKTGKINPHLQQYLPTASKNTATITDRDIRRRLLYAITNEAVHCLNEGIIANTDDGNIGAILGLGYPPFTGGPFAFIAKIGIKTFSKRLLLLAQTYGERFTPALLNEKIFR